VPPLPEEPEAEHCVFVCEKCSAALGGGKMGHSQLWRCLETTVWCEFPVVQVAAVRLLRRVAEDDHTWPRQLLDDLYMDPEVEDWVDNE
jgi:hypothetical protein